MTDSNRYLFSATGEFQLVEEMLEEDPSLGDSARARVEVLRGDAVVIRDDPVS